MEAADIENLQIVQSLLDQWEAGNNELPELQTTLSSTDDPTQLVKEPVADYGDTCFLVPSLFSAEESARIIADCEAMGMESPASPDRSIRSCTRLMVRAPSIIDALWRRLQSVLKPIDFPDGSHPHQLHIHGIPFILKGKWNPVGLNPIVRVCRYQPGQHFGPHYDSHLVKNVDCRSMQTLMIYLTEACDGGSTNFISQVQEMYRDEFDNFSAEPVNVLHSVTPKTGQAIVFNHYRLHEGARLNSGTKYILRTDIMFQRACPADLSDSQRRAVKLLQRAEVMESNRQEGEAAECYRRAFKLCPELEECT